VKPVKKSNSKGLAGIVGAVACAALLVFTPTQEGRELKTYRDIGGVLTYCDGATENAIWGKTYTPAECNAQLDRDLERHAIGVASCVPMEKLTTGQRIAFVDTAYNIGVSAFCGSSMARQANAGNVAASCAALHKWVYVKGKVVRGLALRRERSYKICMETK
jgi:lysozyme